MKQVGSSLGIEVDEPPQSLLADGTEVGLLVGTHAAVLLTSPDAFRQIAAAFDEAGTPLVDEVLPLAAEVVLRGEVRFPWLGVGEVHGGVVAIGILVAQTTEGMAELMDDDRLELLSAGVAQVVGVVDAPAAIVRGVGQDDDVLVGRAGQQVVEPLQVERGEVALAVERVEVRAEGRVEPHALARVAHAAVDGRCQQGNDVEAVAQGFERLVAEEGLHCRAAMVEVGCHLVGRVTLRHIGDVDATRGVGCLLEGNVGRDVPLSFVADEDVGRYDGMRQGCLNMAVEVKEFHRHIDRVAREGHEEDILERAPHMLGFVRSQPLLEERGEGVAVDDLLGAVCPHRDLSVASQRQLGQPCAPTEPSRHLRELIDIEFLPACIACKDIVEPQGAVLEPLAKRLCPSRQHAAKHQQNGR